MKTSTTTIIVKSKDIFEGNTIRFSEEVDGEGSREVVARVLACRYSEDRDQWRYVLECLESQGSDAIQPGITFFRRGDFFGAECEILLETEPDERKV